MPGSWRWFAASLLLAAPALGAVVEEKRVEVTIHGDGSFTESVRLSVRIDEPSDVARWSPYPIALDDHRELRRVEAAVRLPDGKRRAVRSSAIETGALPAQGVLHSSERWALVPFEEARPGAVLELAYEAHERPWFPSGTVVLVEDEPVERLEVVVRGTAPGLRWTVYGGTPLAARAIDGGVAVSGENVPAYEPSPLGPGGIVGRPALRFAWGEGEADWAAVGRWYEALAAGVGRGSPEVVARAREASVGSTTARERIAALLRVAREDVRYVAVEIGVGGYVPSAPEEVLARGWGDCKDKAFLLLDLLAAMGIPARPALVRSAGRGGVDPSFPAPDRFNHMIVAVSAEGLAEDPDLPVGAGFLFVDPTQSVGGLSWLHPGIQGQWALVVEPGGGRLVEVPIVGALEERRFEARLGGFDDPSAGGRAVLELVGSESWAVAEALAAVPPVQRPAQLAALVGTFLPGARVADASWTEIDREGVPASRLEATVERAGPGAAGGGPLPLVPMLPAPRDLDGRDDTVWVDAGRRVTTLRFELPADGCEIAGSPVRIANRVGLLHVASRIEGRDLVVEHRVEIERRRIAPELVAELRELAVAEHRELKRRLRLSCPR